MRIKLPLLNNQQIYVEDKKSIVLVGANGSGKTRMSIWIDENNSDLNIHRISAQKSLNIPEFVSPSELENAKEKFLYGRTGFDDKDWLHTRGKKLNRWNDKPETHLLSDFDYLMEYLFTENYEKSIKYRDQHKEGNLDFDNETLLEQIKNIFENVITHRKLQIDAGKVSVVSSNEENLYNASQMSDGERAIFHFIGEVLCAESNSLIIVDELENHLHSSILKRLWDNIEKSRPDCVFLYITHNFDFAISRVNSQIIWLKSYKNKEWDYKLINEDENTDDDLDCLKLELLGSRQNVMFVEGTKNNSFDQKIYSRIYSEYNVLSLESCSNVIQAVKTYNNTNDLHHMNVVGIIDRDRRSEGEILNLKSDNIYAPDVAEVENLFLLPEVIEIMCKKLIIDYNETFGLVKENTFKFLENHKEEQAILFVKHQVMNIINQNVNKKHNSIDSLKSEIQYISQNINLDEIYKMEIKNIEKIIKDKDYLQALKIINNKGLLNFTKLPSEFGWKADYYQNQVINMLCYDNEYGDRLKDIFKKYIKIE